MTAADVLPDLLPERTRVIEVADFEDALVVFDPRDNRVHLLEGLPAIVLDACDGATPRRTLVDEVVGALHEPADEVAQRIETTVSSFAALGLLEGIDATPEPPCIGCRGEQSGRRGRRDRIRS